MKTRSQRRLEGGGQKREEQQENDEDADKKETENSDEIENAENDGGTGPSEHLTVKRKKLEEELKVEHSGNLMAEPEVDIECKQLTGRAHVYVDGEGHYFDVTLNQTNIQQNNNKFYLMQMLESNEGKQYWVWLRWGRVGFKGQTNLIPFGEKLHGAVNFFCKKFWDKTHNEFLSDDAFKKVHGKYDLIKIDYTRKIVTSEEELNKKEPTASTNSMDERVKSLIQILCDFKAMEKAARHLDYDFQRIPLGKITKEQIRAGYEALTRIEKHINANKFDDRDFTQAVNEYYTRIPHFFGMRTPPMIRTTEALQREIELLDLLTGFEITVAEIAGDPLERHYSRLKWELVPLEKEHDYYKVIEEYLQNTQGPTHNRYKLQLRNIFELRPKGNKDTAKSVRLELDNRKLLWHGSRITNWYSILAQGLRIAPPEAPSTGYMFGKGVYFSDISTKSANYSLSGPEAPGLMMLTEVALGESLDLRDSDDKMHQKLPKGKHSVRGVGRIVPHPEGTKKIDDGVEVPCGKPTNSADAGAGETSLIYNEYIVYSLEQIRERFLIEVGFQFEFEL